MVRFRVFAGAITIAMNVGAPSAQVAPESADTAPVLRDMSPVTDAMLRRPSADDWLHWRRTSDGQGYSPLAEITRDNVQHLQLAWSWAIPAEAPMTIASYLIGFVQHSDIRARDRLAFSSYSDRFFLWPNTQQNLFGL